jgi:hypothetical protein
MIWPAVSAATAAARASSPVASTAGAPVGRQDSLGPQAGQATGSAWNRRLAGSRYSASQTAHSGNERIVVWARSYGSSSMMVARGPQLVQLVNG